MYNELIVHILNLRVNDDLSFIKKKKWFEMISLRLLVIKFIYSVLYLFYFMSNDSNFNQFIFTINQRLLFNSWSKIFEQG